MKKTTAPLIIAEIAQGYEGNPELVGKFVRAALQARADAIKFQIFFADELALPEYPYYKLFKKLELPWNEWKKAVNDAHRHGLEFYSDVFGTQSLAGLHTIGINGYKIHATDMNNERLIKAVARLRRKVFLSIGGCALSEIKKAVRLLKGCSVTLMYGFQGEPTNVCDNHLRRIPFLQKQFKLPIGFQDHADGTSASALYLPFVALGSGVDVIEKHLTLSRAAKMEDYISAIEPAIFAQWAGQIREASAALGMRAIQLTKTELQYRRKVKRAVCTARVIHKGKRITFDDVVFKRSGQNGALTALAEAIGKRARRTLPENISITRRDLR